MQGFHSELSKAAWLAPVLQHIAVNTGLNTGARMLSNLVSGQEDDRPIARKLWGDLKGGMIQTGLRGAVGDLTNQAGELEGPNTKNLPKTLAFTGLSAVVPQLL